MRHFSLITLLERLNAANCSHTGNYLFPTWEENIPLLGIKKIVLFCFSAYFFVPSQTI